MTQKAVEIHLEYRKRDAAQIKNYARSLRGSQVSQLALYTFYSLINIIIQTKYDILNLLIQFQ